MIRSLCGICAPWDLSLDSCNAALCRTLPGIGLHDLAVRLQRAGYVESMRPILKQIAHDAMVARAAFNLVFADARAAEAEEVAELAKILLQRLQQRRAG